MAAASTTMGRLWERLSDSNSIHALSVRKHQRFSLNTMIDPASVDAVACGWNQRLGPNCRTIQVEMVMPFSPSPNPPPPRPPRRRCHQPALLHFGGDDAGGHAAYCAAVVVAMLIARVGALQADMFDVGRTATQRRERGRAWRALSFG